MNKVVSRRQLYEMQICFKGAALVFMAILPVLYEKHLLSARQLGIIGALPALTLIATGLLLPVLYKRENPKLLLIFSVVSGVFAQVFFTLFVFKAGPLALCIIAYIANGLSVALSSVATNTLQANATREGNRFSLFAQIGMMSDIVRIVVPLVISFVFIRTDYRYVGLLHLVLITALGVIVVRLPSSNNIATEPLKLKVLTADRRLVLRMFYEFLDSMSSTQLFVFLPIIMLAKGFSLQSSLSYQVALFTGYLLGRPVIAFIANRASGLRSLQLAELTMIAAVIALLLAHNPYLLIIIVTALGMSGRGTSPLIKAMVFDASSKHSKQHIAALHMTLGDGGNAIAQFSFGLLLASLGASAPFVAAIVIICILLILTTFDRRLPRGYAS